MSQLQDLPGRGLLQSVLQSDLEQVIRDLCGWGVASPHARVAGGSCRQLLLQDGLHSPNRQLGGLRLWENQGHVRGVGTLRVISQQPAEHEPVSIMLLDLG